MSGVASTPPIYTYYSEIFERVQREWLETKGRSKEKMLLLTSLPEFACGITQWGDGEWSSSSHKGLLDDTVNTPVP